MNAIQWTNLMAQALPASARDAILSAATTADVSAAAPQWVYQLGIAVAAVVVTATVGAFTILHYLRNWSRPELIYSVSSATAIRTAPTRYAGKQNIYRTSFQLENAGRQAITKDMFSGQEPITVDLGVPIEDSSVETRPEEMPTPDVPTISGSSVRIEPLTLAPGQVVTISIYTAGRPSVAEVKAPLPEVRLRKRPL